ncbi:MAG: nitroreductase family protein [Candidatus Eremiobacteraeota bacterium]|nr:nitroreductase family protein [Candidatus Eremiobacteraeota bacterium]
MKAPDLSLWDLMSIRRMCRRYQDRAVPRATLLRVLDAARRSPSAGHSQGIRFGVVTEPDKRKEIARAFGEDEYLAKGFPAWLSPAPVHLIAAVSEQAYRERYRLPDKSGGPDQWPVSYPVMDGGKALMSLYLAAEDCGLACGYLGPHAGPDLVKMFDLPEDWRFIGLITLGYRYPEAQGLTRSEKLGWRPFDDVVKWV